MDRNWKVRFQGLESRIFALERNQAIELANVGSDRRAMWRAFAKVAAASSALGALAGALAGAVIGWLS